MRVAVFLLGYGAPLSMDDIPAYLKNIWHGKEPSKAAVDIMRNKYRIVNGRSPLLENMQSIAKLLEEELKKTAPDVNWKVSVGMKYWHPFIESAFDNLVSWDPSVIVVIPLAPHYRRVNGSGEYFEILERAVRKYSSTIGKKIRFIEGWGLREEYASIVAQQINETISNHDFLTADNLAVIFTAHSLPLKLGTKVRLYDQDVRKSAELIIGMVEHEILYDVGYQSKGLRHGKWLGPFVEEVVEELVDKKIKKVILVPFGFACENLETIYDLDVEVKEFCNKIDLQFHRLPTVGTNVSFIRFLARMVMESLHK